MSRKKILLVYPNTMMATLLPVGIASLSACLKEAGFAVELFDTTFYRTESINFEKKKEWLLQVKPFDLTAPFKGDSSDMLRDFQAVVNDYRPDLIGVSVVEDTIPQALQLLGSVRGYNAKVHRVVGGVGATFNPKRLLDSEFIDIVCVGEGEEVFINFCLSEIQTKFSSRVIIGPSGIVNLDDLPFPDFSIFEENRIKRVMHGKTYSMLPVEIDRGCPYSCTYCCAPSLKKVYGKGYCRKKSPSRIIEEMRFLKDRYKPDYIDFGSETFLVRDYLELRRLMIDYQREIGLPFWCQGRPELITEGKIEALKMGGVADMQFGVEHGNEEFRKQWLKRNVSNKQILGGLQIVEKYGIPYTVNNIIGFPDETRELIFDTIELNKEIHPKTMNVYMMTPYKGTWMREYCEKEGLIDLDTQTEQLLDGADIRYRHMTKEEFLGLQRCFPLYVRMPEREKEIKRAEKFDDEGDGIFETLRDEYIRRFYS